jgi:hypothetical protein
MLFQFPDFPFFLPGLIFGGDREMHEFQTELPRQRLQIEVVADHQRDLRLKFPHAVPEDKVMKAMHMTGYKQGHPGNVVGKTEIPFHPELTGQRFKSLTDFAPGNFESLQLPFDPHKKCFRTLRGVLIGMDDIAVMLEDKIGYTGHNPLLIRAGQEQDGIGIDHESISSIQTLR